MVFPRLQWLLCLALLLAAPRFATAILFYSTGDPAHNTTAPTGALTNSGWQFQGTWGVFLGTPIAPKYFITAGHVGGAAGDRFNFRGVDYTTTTYFDDPDSDLRIWRICGTFPEFAPLYTLSNEVSRAVAVFGRGTQRGGEVLVTNHTVRLKGWFWGEWDTVQRWGTNLVASIANLDATLPAGAEPVGDLLKCDFDASGGAEEADLSVGDSGGGLFIKDSGVWKLAGINYGVDGPYNYSMTGSGFLAAIFDKGGLYTETPAGWVLNPDLPGNSPDGFYATRIAAHQDWIQGVLQTAIVDAPPVLQSADIVTGPYTDTAGAVVDTSTKTITAPAPSGNQFYRLRACDLLRITSITRNGTSVILHYQ